MTEQARLELAVDAKTAQQGVKALDQDFGGLHVTMTKAVSQLDTVDKRLEEIGRSSKATAGNTEFLGRGLSQVALNGQKTNEILARLEQGLSRVALNTQRAAAGARAYRAEQAAASQSSATLEQRLKLLGDRAGILRSRFTGIFAGLTGAFVARDFIQTISGFEASLATLRGVTGLDKTGQQFQDIEAQARRLGATTRFTAEQAAEGQVFLARAGFNAQQILSALPATLNLAAAGNLDLGQAADLASNAVTQFNLNASETVRVVDSLVNVSNNSNTNIQQLGEALKFAGPIAAGFNVEIEDAVAAIGKLGDAGIQSTLAGTGLRGFLAALATPSAEAEQRIGKLGIRIEDLDVQARGLIPVLETLNKANLDVVDAFDIFDRRNASTALILSRNVEGVKRLVEVQRENVGAAQKMADVQDDTLRGSLLALRSALQEAYLSAGDDGLAGSFRSIVDEGTVALRILTGTATEAERADASAQVLAFSLETIGRSMLAITGVRLGTYLLNVTRAMAGLNAVAASNPWVALATGIGITGAALIAFTRTSNEAAERLKAIENAAISLGDALGRLESDRVRAGGADPATRASELARAELRAVESARASFEAEIAKSRRGEGGRSVVNASDAAGVLRTDVLRGGRLAPILSIFGPGESDAIARATIEDLVASLRVEAERTGGSITPESLVGALVNPEGSILDIDSFFKARRATGGTRFRTDEQIARAIELGAADRAFALRNRLEAIAGRGGDITDIDTLLAEIAAANFDIVNFTAESVLRLTRVKEEALRAIVEAGKDQTPGGASAGAVSLSEFASSTKSALSAQLDDLTRGRDLTAVEQLTAAMKAAEEAARGQKATEEEIAAFRAKEFPELQKKAELIDKTAEATLRKAQADEEAKRRAEERLDAERGLDDLIRGQREALFLARQTDDQRAVSTELLKANNLAKQAGRTLTIFEAAAITGLAAALRRANDERARANELVTRKPLTSQGGAAALGFDLDFFGAVADQVERARDAQRDFSGFFRSLSDDRTFLQAQIDATLLGRPEDVEQLREATYARRELNEILREAGQLETEAGQAARDRLEGELSGLARLREELRRTEEARQLFDDIGRTGAEALAGLVSGTESWRSAIGGLIQDLSRLALQQFFIKPATGLISDGLSGLFGSSLIPSAKGNAFEGGSIIPMAKGGVLSSRIRFPLNGRETVEAGEAGPEGILPLGRDRLGRLGVILAGGGSTTTSSTTINNIRIGGRGGGGGRRDTFRRSDRQLASDILRGLRAS